MKFLLHLVLLAAALFLLSSSWAASPYRYWFDATMREVSDDSVLFLWLILLSSTALLMTGGIVAWKQKLCVKWMYLALLLVAAWRMIDLSQVK